MRVITPEHISKLYDEICPYMEYKGEEGYQLKQDAPPEIVAKYNEIKEWRSKVFI